MSSNQNKSFSGSLCALGAAALYALSTPFSKLLLKNGMPTFLLAGLLYLGAGAGIGLFLLAEKGLHRPSDSRGRRWNKADLPWTAAMILLDIAAPVLLLAGLAATTAANAALLNNFEVVATALIAAVFFREAVSKRLWLVLGLVTAASVLLTLEGGDSLTFSAGSLCVLGACVCWGIENNCTRRLSSCDPLLIVTLKGWGSGSGSLLLGLLLGERFSALTKAPVLLPAALALGFVAYGLSISLYIYAQRLIGAARTGAFYAAAPFFSAGLGFLLLKEQAGRYFVPALVLLLVAAALDLLPMLKKKAES